VRYNLDHIDVASNAKEVAQKATDNVMMYPSGLVMAKATRLDKENILSYTKHYYVGSERVSAKTGTVAQLGIYPGTLMGTEMPGLNTTMIRTASNTSVTDAGTAVTAVYSAFSLTPPVMDPVIEPERESYLHDMAKMNAFYFHSDHLGSSSYMTNASGKAIQHMEYLPFGETLVDEHSNSFSSPFKFNGKEFDEETGNYYYGARYYDPKWSIFISVDPLAEKYPNWSSYAYGFNSPLRFIDPTGMEAEEPGPVGYAKPPSDKAKVVVVFSNYAKNKDGDFHAAYNAAMKNENVDVILASDLTDLNKTLNSEGKIYNKIFLAGHGSSSAAAQDIGASNYPENSITGEFKAGIKDLGNNVSKSGSIILLGCFTGAEQNGGDSYLQSFADISHRRVYGNQGESYLGPNLFNNQPISGEWDKHGMMYKEMAISNAGTWRVASPGRKNPSEINNIQMNAQGKISLTDQIYTKSKTKR
jgi:RHS repeat-associated protein